MLDGWFDSLKGNIPPDCELIFALDSDNDDLLAQLAGRSKDLHFNGISIYQSGRPYLGDGSLNWRRDRIAQTLNEVRPLIKGRNFLFGLEDDTTLEPGSLLKLAASMQGRVGFVEGVQVGRHQVPMIGAWEVDSLAEPTRITTAKFYENERRPIDGGGLYAFVTYAHEFKHHRFHWHDECFGPDVTYVLSLRRKGYEAYCDTGVVAYHHLPEGQVLDPYKMDTKQFAWHLKDGKWQREELFWW